MGAGSKVVVMAISVMLLVAIVIGVAVGVSKSGHKVGDDFTMPPSTDGGGSGGPATSSKSVAAMCAVTNYKETCQKSLGSVLGNNTTVSIQDIVKAAMEVTLNASLSAMQKAKGFGNATTTDKMQQMALDDCKQLLRDGAEEMQDIISRVNASDVSSLNDRAIDVRVWLSAVMSYQETCLDGVEHPELKAMVQKIIVDAAELTSNALDIITEVAATFQNLQGLQIPLKTTPETRRRLLTTTAHGLDEEGLPTWFSQGDRRLLAAVGSGRAQPNVVVAQDGSGNFKTINDAINAMPANYQGRYVIYVKAGIYNENVIITKEKKNILMYGDGPRKSIVTGSKNYVDGTPTFRTATFVTMADGFIGKAMGFQNTAGPEKHQAVALRVQGDISAFFNCRMDGYQDTLYAQANRQFYRNCVVSGTVDFIFGDGTTILQNCLIIIRRPMDNQQNTVTAHGRKNDNEPTGIVIQNCRIVPDQKLFPDRLKIPSYLGRPWKEFSRTVIMESTIGDLIRPEGWMPWAGDFALNTLYYAEYGNRGPGSNTARRVRWRGYRVIGRTEAFQFTVAPFIQGNRWLGYAGIPHILGFKH